MSFKAIQNMMAHGMDTSHGIPKGVFKKKAFKRNPSKARNVKYNHASGWPVSI